MVFLKASPTTDIFIMALSNKCITAKDIKPARWFNGESTLINHIRIVSWQLIAISPIVSLPLTVLTVSLKGKP